MGRTGGRARRAVERSEGGVCMTLVYKSIILEPRCGGGVGGSDEGRGVEGGGRGKGAQLLKIPKQVQCHK